MPPAIARHRHQEEARMRTPLAVAVALAVGTSLLAQQPATPPGPKSPSPTYPTPAPSAKPGTKPPRLAADDAAFQQLASTYEAAFNKGDVKGVARLYTADALRIMPDGRFLTGLPAIEKSYVEAFAGPFKGATLTLRPGTSRTLTSDVALIEGTYEVATPAGPIKGRYLNTLMRQGGAWKLASVVTVPETPAGAK
jgi:uncharacterized protein (TIGR02246 family)